MGLMWCGAFGNLAPTCLGSAEWVLSAVIVFKWRATAGWEEIDGRN